MYVYIYIYLLYVCSKIPKSFWSNPPSLLEQNTVLEQQSITFRAKACFGAALHHLWSKNFFGNNTPSLLELKLALEQHAITFGAKACLGATLHHFWSKSLFWSNPPSLLGQKLAWEQHSITFGPKACFGTTLHRFSNKRKDEVIRGPVRSGPVRPVRASCTGADRMDRTGPDRAKLDLASARCRPCPVRSGPSSPLQCPGPKAPGPDRPDGPDRTGRTGWGRAARAPSPPLYN